MQSVDFYSVTSKPFMQTCGVDSLPVMDDNECGWHGIDAGFTDKGITFSVTKRRPMTGAKPELKRGSTYYVYANIMDE